MKDASVNVELVKALKTRGHDIMSNMVKTLKEAFEAVAELPESDQEQIGRSLLSHVEKLRRLQGELDKGIRSLAAGKGEGLNVGLFLRDMNEDHERT